MPEKFTQEKYNRAVLVGLNAFSLSREENATEESMEELSALLETAGGETVGVVMQQKDSPDARTFIGEGKVPRSISCRTAERRALERRSWCRRMVLEDSPAACWVSV